MVKIVHTVTVDFRKREEALKHVNMLNELGYIAKLDQREEKSDAEEESKRRAREG